MRRFIFNSLNVTAYCELTVNGVGFAPIVFFPIISFFSGL